MKRLVLLALVGAILLHAIPVLADDGFYVIAGSGGDGTKITRVPYTINAPGFYYLAGDLTYSGSGTAITVDADDITLDLMGFSLTCTGTSGETNGILTLGSPVCKNLEIRNGTISGFFFGINAGGTDHRISNIRAVNCKRLGITLVGKNTLVQDCTLSNNNIGGIDFSIGTGMITGCVASNNGQYGIRLIGAGSVIGNVATNNSSTGTTGFELGTGNILVDRNSAFGNGTNYSGGPTNPAYWGINAGR